VEDKKHGKGVYTYAHGRIRHETWQQGCRVEDPKQKYISSLAGHTHISALTDGLQPQLGSWYNRWSCCASSTWGATRSCY
jgi:hypothetical protein